VSIFGTEKRCEEKRKIYALLTEERVQERSWWYGECVSAHAVEQMK